MKMNTPFRPGIDVVSVSGATITPEDIDCVVETAKKGWFTEGEKHKAFSEELKRMLGRPITLCNSGSSAMLIATATCKEYINWKRMRDKRGLFPGQYVITCATGFPTTIVPAIQLGYKPYFVDVDQKTLNADLGLVISAMEDDKVAGVILAHTLGFPYNAKLIREVADIHNKFFIEDCADALGAKVYENPVGTFGDASIFSFFPAHHITTGEGGAVAYRNGRLAKAGNSFCSWGRDCWCKPGDNDTCNKRFGWKWENLPAGYDHKYTFTRLGYNLKMTELQAALGLSQFSRLDAIVNKRVENFVYLYMGLSRYSEYLSFVSCSSEFDISPFGFPITVTSSAFTRRELVDFLEQNKIATRPIFAGNLARQPMMENIPFLTASDLKNSDYVMNNSFWIGCHDGLSYSQLAYVLEIFDHFFRSRGL